MKYSVFTKILEKKNLTLKEVAAAIEMSTVGLRDGINNESLSMKKVKLLCEFTGISVSDFFGVSDPTQNSQTAIGIANTNNSDLVIQTLREELKQKNEQINSLLRLLPKPQ